MSDVDSEAADTLHSYFGPSGSPKAKRARTEGAAAWPDIEMAGADEPPSSDDEASVAKRSVFSGIASSVATVRPASPATPAPAPHPNWIFHESNQPDFCVSEYRWKVIAELRKRRLMREHANTNRARGNRAAATAPAPSPNQGAASSSATNVADYVILSDDSDSDDDDGNNNGAAPAPAPAPAQPSTRASTPASTPAPKLDMPSVVEEEEEDTSEVVDRYDAPLASIGPEHPASLCTSAVLSYCPPAPLDPDDTDGLFAPFLLKEHVLSAAQLHPVALAMRAFDRGRAFLIGDGTGVGKGRESMGVIMSHWYRSRSRRALIVSTGSLASDVLRDFNDCRVAEAFPGTTFFDASRALPKPGELSSRAVIFTTYSQIRSPQKGHAPYAELIQARGSRPAGTLVLDEVHKGAGNNNTATYKEIEKLIEASPDSPLLCMSATFASHIDGLRMLAPRLGLVSEEAADGTAFPSFGELKSALALHGATGLELLTAQLSYENLFLARVISYHGTRTEHLACAMSEEHEQLYTACASIYADLWNTDLFVTKQPKGYFASSKVRFFKSLTLLAKLKDVVARVRAELAQGRQVVVTTLGTSEAALKRADADEVELSGGVSALRDEVKGTIRYARDHCTPSLTQEAELDAIAARVDGLNLSQCGALDLFKHELHEFGVAELTGRTNELRWDASKNGWFPRKMHNDIVKARALFQRGVCRVALVSAVASTGISLHDDGGADDGLSHPRTMVLFELPWSAAASVQLLGRVHRSAQRSEPLFLTTAITTAEQRFSAAVALRLRQLGALTTGDQRDDGGSNIALDGELLLSAAGNRAAKHVADLRNIGVRKEAAGRQLLNFSLGLAPSESEELIQEFFELAETEHRKDVAHGKIAPPRATLKEDGVKTVLLDTFRRPGVELTKWRLDRRLTWEDVCAKKDELESNGLCTVGFASSIASEAPGLALCQYRHGYVMARCFFIDGRIARVHPDKLVSTHQGIATRWRNTYEHTQHLVQHLAMVPCLEALKVLTKLPKTYRVEYADGRRQLGIYIPQELVQSLRSPPTVSTEP